jgi:uncharacterized protein (TIGR03083 family)
MTMTSDRLSHPLRPAMPRDTAMRLAAAEYERVLQVLRSLPAAHWDRPTDCPGWDVRALAAHVLGMVEMAASVREQARQNRAARRRGGVFIDALTALQVQERASMSPAEIVQRFAARAPKAARGRRRAPAFIRRRPMPVPQAINGRDEVWTLGYLIDTILTRDPWMHRVDLARATGGELVLSPDHDGVLVADVVSEWAARHGRPFALRLTGPAGGTWVSGTGGEEIEMDAIEFCRVLSGRGTADGLLATQVPF